MSEFGTCHQRTQISPTASTELTYTRGESARFPPAPGPRSKRGPRPVSSRTPGRGRISRWRRRSRTRWRRGGCARSRAASRRGCTRARRLWGGRPIGPGSRTGRRRRTHNRLCIILDRHSQLCSFSLITCTKGGGVGLHIRTQRESQYRLSRLITSSRRLVPSSNVMAPYKTFR